MLRVLILACDGLPQRHFIARASERYELTGVVFQATPKAKGSVQERLKRYANPGRLGRHLLARAVLPAYERRAEPVRRELFSIGGEIPELPEGVPVLRVASVNSAECVELARSSHADVICVNGTDLLRPPMLELADRFPRGIINLHTGLSPYTRGGNCNLWALVEGHPEWVGVTIHYIDPGIDSGDLILTRQVPLFEDDFFEKIHARAFGLGFDLMFEALRQLEEGRVERVPQWMEGRLYLRRTGYIYEPWIRVRANRALKRGLVSRYLASKDEFDAMIRLIGEANG